MKWATRRSCRTQVVPVSVHHGGRPHHRTQAPEQPPSPPSTGRPGMTSGSAMVPLPTTAAHPPGRGGAIGSVRSAGWNQSAPGLPQVPLQQCCGRARRSRGMELRCGRREARGILRLRLTLTRSSAARFQTPPSPRRCRVRSRRDIENIASSVGLSTAPFPSHFHRHLPESPSLSPELPLFASPHHGTPMSPGAA